MRTKDYLQWNIKIRNSDELREKVKAIRNDGIDNMMIMADFDQTISTMYMPDPLVAERNERVSMINGDVDLDADGNQKEAVKADPSMKVIFQCDRIT